MLAFEALADNGAVAVEGQQQPRDDGEFGVGGLGQLAQRARFDVTTM